jgi:hypothetical protein
MDLSASMRFDHELLTVERDHTVNCMLELTAGLLHASGPFERVLVIPFSLVVPLVGILAWWAEGLPLWGEGSRWVTVSLLLFLTLIPLVPIIFLPRGRVFEGALAGAVDAGQVTPELEEALRDPVVGAAYTYEMVVVIVVLLLMVTKPF